MRYGKGVPFRSSGGEAAKIEMLEFEFPEPQTAVCDCCGGLTTRLTRFVSDDGNAYAIYYAAYGEKYGDKRLVGVVSLGDWGVSDVIPETRVAFAFELWLHEGNYQVGIIDANHSPWKDARIIGKKQTREEALSHPWIEEVFHITDHMTTDDPAIKEFFEIAH
jgi:hypothetical protein